MLTLVALLLKRCCLRVTPSGGSEEDYQPHQWWLLPTLVTHLMLATGGQGDDSLPACGNFYIPQKGFVMGGNADIAPLSPKWRVPVSRY